MKQVTALLLAVMLMLGSVAFAQEAMAAPKPYTLAGMDNAQFGASGWLGGATYRSWVDNLFFSRMETLTGIGFELKQYTDPEEWAQAKAAMKAGAEMPDVLFKAALSSAECMEMRERGALVDLLPLLEANCPNLWAILEENPDFLRALTLPDGSVPALPYIYVTPIQNCMWVNTAWLDTLKLKEPTTAEELVKVLTAFRDRDPNGNGQKDEIPFGFLGAFDLKYLAHAFGMYANDYNIYVKNDKVCFMPLDEDFRTFVTWLRDLYVEGLIDKNGFTTMDAMRVVNDSNTKPTYGIIMATQAAAVFNTSWAMEYMPMTPLTFDGSTVYRATVGNLLRGTFAVTTACDAPEKMLQWVDSLYGEEGAKLAYIGLENIDYLVDGDGTWRYNESVANDSLFSLNTLITGGGTLPGTALDDFQMNYNDDSLRKITEKLRKVYSVSVMPFPYCHLTRTQQEEITKLQNGIGYCVDMQISRWVLGEQEITDETVNAFEQTLYDLGLKDFIGIWQGIYDNL